MTATIEEVDTDWLSLLDFEHEPPCEVALEDCDRSAEWKVVKKCCGISVLLCDPHMRDKREMIRSGPALWYCTDCETQVLCMNPYISITKI